MEQYFGVFSQKEYVPPPYAFFVYWQAGKPRYADGAPRVCARVVVDTRTMKIIDTKGEYKPYEMDIVDMKPGMMLPEEAMVLAAKSVAETIGEPWPHLPSRSRIDCIGGRYYLIYFPNVEHKDGTLDDSFFRAIVTIDAATRRPLAVKVGLGTIQTKEMQEWVAELEKEAAADNATTRPSARP